MPIVSAKELGKFLEKEGFVAIRQKGSHRFFRHTDGRTVVVPIHSNKDIGKGLLKAVLEEIRINREEFIKKMK